MREGLDSVKEVITRDSGTKRETLGIKKVVIPPRGWNKRSSIELVDCEVEAGLP